MHRPHPHSLPNCTSYHVYKLYGNLYLLNYRLYWYFLARKKKKLVAFFFRTPAGNNSSWACWGKGVSGKSWGGRETGENHFRGPTFLDT